MEQSQLLRSVNLGARHKAGYIVASRRSHEAIDTQRLALNGQFERIRANEEQLAANAMDLSQVYRDLRESQRQLKRTYLATLPSLAYVL